MGSEEIARLRALADLAQAALRRAATAIDVKTGYACPEPDCGLRYRHRHGDVWWPPEGEPWPPRRTGVEP